jgi:hypothetical protein
MLPIGLHFSPKMKNPYLKKLEVGVINPPDAE